MKHILLLVFLTAQSLLAKPPGIYPDKKLTPGMVAPVTQAKVLRAGDTVDARPVTGQAKWEVLVRCKPARGEDQVRRRRAYPVACQFEEDRRLVCHGRQASSLCCDSRDGCLP